MHAYQQIPINIEYNLFGAKHKQTENHSIWLSPDHSGYTKEHHLAKNNLFATIIHWWTNHQRQTNTFMVSQFTKPTMQTIWGESLSHGVQYLR